MIYSPLKIVSFSDDDDCAEERPFDPWRAPCTTASEALVQNVIDVLEAHELSEKLRRRKRKVADDLRFRKIVSALTCDLALMVLTDDSRAAYVSRSHRDLGSSSRYGNPCSSKALPKILDLMASPEVGFICMDIGYQTDKGDRKKTTIRPAAKFCELVHDLAVSPSDIAELQRPETIELKATPKLHGKKASRIDYKDCDQTRRFRKEMMGINKHLISANIEYTGHLPVDVNKRQLRRIFTRERFDLGGRLFGGFWQPLGKAERLHHIKINGEEVLELDYGQIMPRLAYASIRKVPKMADLYAIPGFEGYRDGIKKVMSAMMFVEQPLRRFPQGTRKLFPKRTRIEDVTGAIMSAHPEIASQFYTGIGHRCQYLESQILVEVLRILNEMGVIALPIHDAILVPASSEILATRVMLYTFKLWTGIEGEVTKLTALDLGYEARPAAA